MSVEADQDSPLLGSRQEQPLERRLLPQPCMEQKRPWAVKQDIRAAAPLMIMVTGESAVFDLEEFIHFHE